MQCAGGCQAIAGEGSEAHHLTHRPQREGRTQSVVHHHHQCVCVCVCVCVACVCMCNFIIS